MNKMKSLSVLALTLMLTGVLAACGNDQAASPSPSTSSDSQADSSANDQSREDNDAHPTDEVDIDKENSTESPTDSAIGEAQEETDLDATTGDPTPSDNESKDNAETDSTPAETKPDESASDSVSSTNSAATGGTTGTAPATTPAADEQSGEGSYVGLADAHSAEIEVDGEAVMYQLSEEAQTQLGQIPADAQVTFTYTEEDFDSETKVLTITDIKEAK